MSMYIVYCFLEYLAKHEEETVTSERRETMLEQEKKTSKWLIFQFPLSGWPLD